MRAFRVLMVIYFSFLYNVNSLGISRRYWRISSSSFEVKQYLPPPSASPREVGRYCITSQDSEDILQYLLEMPRLLSHYHMLIKSYCEIKDFWQIIEFQYLALRARTKIQCYFISLRSMITQFISLGPSGLEK